MNASYPFNAIEFVLNFAKIKLSDVDQVIFFEKPFLKFERLLRDLRCLCSKRFQVFLHGNAIMVKGKIISKKNAFQ